MATYKYRMGGGTDSIPKKGYEMGGMTAPSIEERVEEVKSKILEALEGGATDQEINEIIRESGLQDKYEFNWDGVEMKVDARPIEENRFGPRELPGQRGDAFGGGPEPGEVPSKPNRNLMDMLKAARSKAEMEQGGRTYAGQYMGKIMEDEGGKYAMYDDGEGNKTKAYFMEDPGQVGEFVPDNDYIFESRDGKTFARLAPGFEDQRNPKKAPRALLKSKTSWRSCKTWVESLLEAERPTDTNREAPQMATLSHLHGSQMILSLQTSHSWAPTTRTS